MNPEDIVGSPPARLPFPVTRAQAEPVGSDGNTLHGHFSTFNDWYEVDSLFEGHFLERVAPGAFRKTIRESRDQMKVLYDHGSDPSIGNKVLGSIDSLREDDIGPAYEVSLFDAPFIDDLRSGLKAGVYGSSFRFQVEKDKWDREPEKSDYNPGALPERTITETRTFEFGPVTFPANPNATAGVRSTTDDYYRRSRDPEQFGDLLRSARLARTPVTGAAAQADEPPSGTPPVEPPRSDTPRPVDQPTTKENRTMEDTVPAAVSRAERPGRITQLRTDASRFVDEHAGTLTADEQAEWDTMTTELRTLEAAEQADEERRRFIGERSVVPTAVDVRPALPNVKRERVRDIYDLGEIRAQSRNHEDEMQLTRDSAMRVAEVARYAHPDADVPKTQGHIANLLDHHDTKDKELARRIIGSGSPQYLQAFGRYLRTGRMDESRYAPWTVQTDATGGFAVPFFFDPTLVHVGAHTTINPYRRACRVIPIVGTDTYNGVTTTAVLVARAAEAVAVAEGGPVTVGQISAIVGKVHALVTASVELFEDRPDIASEFASLIAEGKDTEEESIFTLGVGDALGAGFNPIGMLCTRGTTGAYTANETATNNTFAIADLYTTEAAVPIRDRMNAAWFMGRATIRAIQAMETAGGQLFGGQNYASVGYPQNDPFGNTGLRLMNYPIWEVPSAPTGVVDNTIIGSLVNPSTFYIIERIGMTVELIPTRVDGSGLPTGQRGLYAWWRNTAKPAYVGGGRTIAINPA